MIEEQYFLFFAVGSSVIVPARLVIPLSVCSCKYCFISYISYVTFAPGTF